MTDETNRNSGFRDELQNDPAARMASELTGVDEPENALPALTFEEVPDTIRQAAARAGWQSLMPVQLHTMPYFLQRRDLMVQSRTGSGKTGAYLLPLIDRIDPHKNECQALVLVPTRELALQVVHEAEVLYQELGINIAAVYGGVGYGKQTDALKAGAQLVVGTPGRVLDHLLRRTLTLDALRVLLFDEADRMLSIGFYPDMKEVQRYLPRRRISTYLFSATYPPHVVRLAGEFLHDPQMLSLSHSQVHITQTPHVFYECKPMEKDRVLVRIIEIENPASAIIFCNTKSNVHYVTAVLQGFGYNADELSADLSQAKREQVLKKLRNGQVRFLVATDVAARGIDIPDLSHVVLYEPPEDHESYIHRAGRTGRAGASGEVISLVDIMQKLELGRIAKHYQIDMQMRPTPTDEDVAKVATERMTAMLEAKLRSRSPLQRERMQRFMPMVRQMAEDEEQMKLVAMLIDELYQDSLHAAPPAPSAEEHRQRPAARPAPRTAPAPRPQQAAAGNEQQDSDPRPKRRRRRRKPASSE
jgi:ATP-dependent RNA helicase DeaD